MAFSLYETMEKHIDIDLFNIMLSTCDVMVPCVIIIINTQNSELWQIPNISMSRHGVIQIG